MSVDNGFERGRPEQRHVPEDDENGVRILCACPEADSGRITRAELGFLDNTNRPVGQRGDDAVCTVANNHDGLIRFEWLGGCQSPLKEAPAAGAMKHLGEIRLHSRALPCCEHDHGEMHGASMGCRWGDRARTRTGWTKTTCAASYTTPQGWP